MRALRRAPACSHTFRFRTPAKRAQALPEEPRLSRDQAGQACDAAETLLRDNNWKARAGCRRGNATPACVPLPAATAGVA